MAKQLYIKWRCGDFFLKFLYKSSVFDIWFSIDIIPIPNHKNINL